MKDYVASLPLIDALWWFIENRPEDTDIFFDLRERVRSQPHEPICHLMTHQQQMDADGTMVGVSRQALEEVLAVFK